MSLACASGVNGCQKLAQKEFLNKTTPVIVLRLRSPACVWTASVLGHPS
jgi:hypothetical protein